MQPYKTIITSLLFVLFSIAYSSSAYAAQVIVLPAVVPAHIGESVSLSVQVDSAADLTGFQFDFSFVPSFLEVKSVSLNPSFEHQVKSSFDNGTGRGLVAAYGVNAYPAPGNNLVLATIEFTVKGGGTALVNITNHVLGTIDGDEILTNQGAVTGTINTSGATTATVTLGNLSQTYDGTAKPVTVTTVPPNLPVSITYDGSSVVPVNAGSYVVVATVTDSSFAGSAIGNLLISGATPFRIAGSMPRYFPTLAEAYLNAKNNDVIELKSGAVYEDLTANREITVFIKGGFNDVFSSNAAGYTNIHGTMSLISGQVILEDICLISDNSAPDSVAPNVSLGVSGSLASLNVPITFTAIDGVGVTGYLLSESSARPASTDAGWLNSAPSHFTFTGFGSHTLYAYAKDAAGNIGSAHIQLNISPTLIVYINGNGSVNSDPSGIVCNNTSSTGCSSGFGYTSTVKLKATNSWYSTFAGWNIVDCSGTGDCSVTMNGDVGVTATFDLRPYARLQSVPSIPYGRLGDAYNAANPNGIIQAKNPAIVVFTENLVFDKPYDVILEGGFDADFQNKSGYSAVNGTVTIINGSVTVNGIALQ